MIPTFSICMFGLELRQEKNCCRHFPFVIIQKVFFTQTLTDSLLALALISRDPPKSKSEQVITTLSFERKGRLLGSARRENNGQNNYYFSSLLFPTFIRELSCLFTLSITKADQFRFPGNCLPTPPLNHHFTLCEN